MNVRIDLFKLILEFCLSNNDKIVLKDYLALIKFFHEIKDKQFSGVIEDIPVEYYIEFIVEILKDYSKKQFNKSFILNRLLEESENKEFFSQIISRVKEISDTDVFNLRNFINERLRFKVLYAKADELETLIEDLKDNSYGSISDITIKFEKIIKELFKFFNKYNITKNMSEVMDCISDEEGLLSLAMNLHKKLNTQGYIIPTNFKRLDNALSGGLVRGECTYFFAKTGGFKSGLFLNILSSIKAHSLDVECFDKTKIPMIMYISLENTQEITFARLAKLILNLSRNEIKNYDPVDLAKEINKKFNLDSNNNVRINFVYRKSKSIDIFDIYSMIEEKEAEGYEIVGIVCDYAALMKPLQVKEKRLELDEIAREFADLAVIKKLFVVSGGQLNRDVFKGNKPNMGMIAEALSVTSHLDYVFILDRYKHNKYNRYIIDFYNGKQRNNEGNSEEKFYEYSDKENMFLLYPSGIYEDQIIMENSSSDIEEETPKKYKSPKITTGNQTHSLSDDFFTINA